MQPDEKRFLIATKYAAPAPGKRPQWADRPHKQAITTEDRQKIVGWHYHKCTKAQTFDGVALYCGCPPMTVNEALVKEVRYQPVSQQ